MSRLYYRESGRAIPTLGEELSAWRRARKRIRLPSTNADARLYVLARAEQECAIPLRVSVNNRTTIDVAPRGVGFHRWYEVPLPASILIGGENAIEFWCDTPHVGKWSVAVEYREGGRSESSHDGGESWRSSALGHAGIGRGEYVARVRISEGEDPPPPSVHFETQRSAGLRRIRAFLPTELKADSGSPLARVRRLSSWLSLRWPYLTTREGIIHAPWDPPAIDAWARSGRGAAGQPPVIWCVHFSISLALLCAALGITARCAVVCEENTKNGHSVTEVWIPELRRWIVIDPTFDMTFEAGGIPLSIEGIREHSGNLRRLARKGDGFKRRLAGEELRSFWEDAYASGRCFTHRSVWVRTDVLTHPRLVPPAHGALSFCETNLVWEHRSHAGEFPMFPYAAPPEYFTAPPGVNAQHNG